MAVYVDNMRAKFGRMIMCHMMADTLKELHEMADKIGIKRKWFQDHKKYPHYDISLGKRNIALANGAIEMKSTELLKLMRGKFENKNQISNGDRG